MTCKDCIYEPECILRISYGMGDDGDKELNNMEECCKAFKNTADYAEVKHGEWVQEWEPQPLLDDYDEIPYVKCSLCGHEEWGIDIESGNAPNYCENCGAIMRGETNGEK